MTYTVYTNNTCTTGAQDAGTKTVTNGVGARLERRSPSTRAGDFYWQAVYSGDANNNGATSVCTSEHLVVNKKQPAMSTAQNLIPNDDATISGASSNAGGTITFNLFAPADATCAGTPALTQTVTVNGNGTYSTTNTTFVASSAGDVALAGQLQRRHQQRVDNVRLRRRDGSPSPTTEERHKEQPDADKQSTAPDAFTGRGP